MTPFVRRRSLLPVGVGLGAAALGRAATAQPSRTLTVGLSNLRPVLEPAHSQAQFAAGYRVIPNLFESPFRLDWAGSLGLQPGLAERMTRVDDHTVEVVLRPGVRMHDGREMTSADWTATFSQERLLGPDAPGRGVRRAHQGTLQGVEAVDPLTVRFVASGPDPVLEKRLAAWGSQVVSGEALRRAASFDSWAVAPIGTGPYRAGQLRRDESVTLLPHKEYWGGTPPAAELRFRAVPEIGSRIAGLMAGDYDIISDVTPDLFPEIERRPGFQVVGGSTTIFRLVNFDVKGNPQLASAELRRALSLAVDRKLLVDSIWGGRLTVPNGLQYPAHGALYDPARRPYAYDPDQARDLVRRSGYRGEPIPYRVTGSFVPAELPTSQALVGMWQQVGVNVVLETVENYTQLFRRPGSGIYNYAASLWYPDPLSDIWRIYGPGGLVQASEKVWSNEEFNRLGTVLETSMDQPERKRVFQRMVDIFDWEDPPAIALYMEGLFYGLRPGVLWQPVPAWPMEFGPGRLTLASR